VPADLGSIFEEQPAGVLRVLNAWEYVNQAPFDDEPNTFEFHRGDRPNWGLLAQGLSFERDLESTLVERLIDFVTEPEPTPRCDIVLSPAGYGMSTLLLSVATWFARQRASGSILLLRPGQQPRPADVEFAVGHLPTPIVLIVDDAANHVQQLDDIWQYIRELRAPVYLLMGERTNEWLQAHPRVKPLEWELGPLSDGEIELLLSSLEKASALGHLATLEPRLRFAAVKQRNQQDLLVTMREVTEGRAFDAIIEDEYRSIIDPKARELYALVSCFSRVSALARDYLLMDASGLLSGDFYKQVRDNLRGVVYPVVVDEARGIWAYTCRHRIIAEIVWHRCMDADERQSTLSKALRGLNLTFGIDAKAFEAFTRDDRGVDSLNGLEAKTRFFEDACRKDGRNAYVRQHYARMLRREKKYELALGQVERAVSLRPHTPAIEHTRGVILADLALDAETPEMGRRRLAQSEAAFQEALRGNSRDEYSYRSLADLYLDWAKRCGSTAEAAEYATKAQNVVFSGLRFARNLEGLYVASADIEEYLGHTPERIEALRSAVAAAPESSVARYLLGMVLRRESRADEAREVLTAGLENAPDDPNLAFAYALALHESGAPYATSIAALRLASFSGMRQPNFVATLGGMLVMDGQSQEAVDVWKRAWDSKFSVADRNRVQFVPRPGGEAVRLRGEVSQMGFGRALIACPGYPEFFCRASTYGSLDLRQGVGLIFTPAFCARGPVALSLEIA
jgi:tetratricopeptide (TPR) repeat protein